MNLFTNTFPVHFLRKTFIEFIHEFQRVPSKCVLAIFANVSAPGSSVGCTCQADGQRGLTGSQNQQTPDNCWLPQGSSYDSFSFSSSSSNSNDTNHNHHKAVAIAVDYDELLPEMSLPCGVFAAWLHLCVPIFLFIIIFVFLFVSLAAAFLAKVYQRGKILTFLCAFHFGAFSRISQEFAFCTLIKRTRTH